MINELIDKAFAEDIPSGDITTRSLQEQKQFGYARLIAKQDLILSGASLFENSLKHKDPDIEVQWLFKDSEQVLSGQTVAELSGDLIAMIQSERVALNFLGYLSGIATTTSEYASACQGTTTKILDTRKTLPLYREVSKKAVRDGGGFNHRLNLSDGVLIKENHIAIAGDFKTCIEQIKNASEQPIEVEVQNLKETALAVESKVSRIMLDNMSIDEMKSCLAIIPENIEVEASGNMTLDRIPQVAQLGVNYISVGALTHSVKNADFSMIFDWSR